MPRWRLIESSRITPRHVRVDQRGKDWGWWVGGWRQRSTSAPLAQLAVQSLTQFSCPRRRFYVPLHQCRRQRAPPAACGSEGQLPVADSQRASRAHGEPAGRTALASCWQRVDALALLLLLRRSFTTFFTTVQVVFNDSYIYTDITSCSPEVVKARDSCSS